VRTAEFAPLTAIHPACRRGAAEGGVRRVCGLPPGLTCAGAGCCADLLARWRRSPLHRCRPQSCRRCPALASHPLHIVPNYTPPEAIVRGVTFQHLIGYHRTDLLSLHSILPELLRQLPDGDRQALLGLCVAARRLQHRLLFDPPQLRWHCRLQSLYSTPFSKETQQNPRTHDVCWNHLIILLSMFLMWPGCPVLGCSSIRMRRWQCTRCALRPTLQRQRLPSCLWPPVWHLACQKRRRLAQQCSTPAAVMQGSRMRVHKFSKMQRRHRCRQLWWVWQDGLLQRHQPLHWAPTHCSPWTALPAISGCHYITLLAVSCPAAK
jgi:hypothetical protein